MGACLAQVNLASAETLQRLSGLLEGHEGTLRVIERGDRAPLRRHPNFKLFATMNPPTDAGKKDLPPVRIEPPAPSFKNLHFRAP